MDLDAIGANVRVLLNLMRTRNPAATVMAVVKADAYGHGAVPAARAALAGGATRLGVATPTEALQLRAAGLDVPILAWLWPPGEGIAEALARDVEVGVSSLGHLAAVLDQARAEVARHPRQGGHRARPRRGRVGARSPRCWTRWPPRSARAGCASSG